MIVIDAREGVSGDMLLAAMLGSLNEPGRKNAVHSIARACASRGLEFKMIDIEDQGDAGLGIAYGAGPPTEPDASRQSCYSRLAQLERDIGSASEIGRKILDLVFVAEAEAHGVPVEEVHLHEIGRTQALVNIAGIGLAASVLEREGAGGFVSSAITTGGGMVVVSHGAVRIPAPASAILLRGLKHQKGDSPGERATPTGIAAVRALAESQIDSLPSEFRRRTVGFGTKRFAGRLGRTALLRL